MNSISSGKKRLIFALDIGNNLESILEWVSLLKDHVGMFKVGKEAFTRFGPLLIKEISDLGAAVFLDLKFHDIPNTVARAAEAAVRLKVSMLNVHALGGYEMMNRTAEAVRMISQKEKIPHPDILAVTVLTSLDDSDLKTLGFNCTADILAGRLAKMAQNAGLSGVVASAQDVRTLRNICGKNFIIVTPGIRVAEEIREDDQKRTMTAKEAIKAGADFIVVGRPIRTADDPVAMAEKINAEINEGLAAL
ncbi:MAG: orotidine-5'-phosphate decarboxylase [Syntrophales bacterium]|jgi:orotidine-5'-phosphate decarboxylase|nr:orotidine-5'-phosphate decarboxylase [Syntrophales bacterium]MDY0043863.1 orotidine-5'-phosphate decarboxylase [Syntrophales bacterium]